MTKTTSFLSLFLFVSLGTLSAQNSWEKATETADSLERSDRFDASLPYRGIAVEAAKNAPDSLQGLMLALKEFTQAEHDFRSSDKKPADTYALMQNAVGALAQFAPSQRIYKPYWLMAQHAYDRMQNLPDAKKYLDSALVHHAWSQRGDTLFLIGAMEFSGFLSVLFQEYEKAVEVSEKGLALSDLHGAKTDKDLETKAKLLYNLALVHNNQFLDIPQKEHYYTVESEKVLGKMDRPDFEHLVLIYRRLALFERDYGNYKNAKGYLNKALNLHELHRQEIHDKLGVGFKLELALYRALIVILMESGDEAGMLATLGKIEDLAAGHVFDEAEKGSHKGALRQIGNYYLYTREQPDMALKYIDKAREIQTDKSKSPHMIGSFDRGIGLQYATAHFLKKDHHKSFALLDGMESVETLNISQKILFHELRALLFLDLDKTDKAIKEIDRLLVILNPNNVDFQFSRDKAGDFTPGNGILDAEVLVRLAKAWRASHDRASLEEETLYWMALSQFEKNMGNHPLTKDLKNSVDKIVSGLIEAALSREFGIPESNRLITFMETVDSHSLVNKFLLNRELAGNSKLYKLVEEQQFIRAQITQIKKQQQNSGEGDLSQELFEKELELKSLQEKLASESRGNALFEKPEINLGAVSDKSIFKFKAVGDILYKIHIHNGQVTYGKTGDYTALTEEIKGFLTGLTDLQVELGTLRAQGESLYRKLFQSPLDPTLPTVILPDGLLYFLPFGLLVENNHYLMENHTISYAANLSIIQAGIIPDKGKRNQGVAFFAPAYSGSLAGDQLAVRGVPYALKGAQEEVDEIAKLVQGKKYTGDAASKTAFKALADDVSIVHLAMHSTLNDEDPELSSLIFSDAEKDYELHISELYGLNFDADLAVLSACNTAIGGFKDGGSLVSMHHAFTTAGIPATLASLWNAPDQSTKEIMVSFYTYLKEGKNKAQALRLAKLDYLDRTKNEKLDHPFYWAGFILSGNDAPIPFSEPFWTLPVIGTLLLSMLAILLFIGHSVKKERKWLRLLGIPSQRF